MADTTIRGLAGGDSGQPAADAWFIAQATSGATTPLAHSFASIGGLEQASNTLTTANLTASVGTLHLVTVSGLTADRDFILPDTAKVGQRVGVYLVTASPTAFELNIKTAATGSLINGVDASATAHTQLLILGEMLVFECVNAGGAGDTDWIRVYDGRKPCHATMADTSGTASHYADSVSTTPAYNVATVNVGSIADTTGDQILIRRAGNYSISMSANTGAEMGIGIVMQLLLTVNGTTHVRAAQYSPVASGLIGFGIGRVAALVAGDVLVGKVYHNKGSAITWSTNVAYAPRINVVEVL